MRSIKTATRTLTISLPNKFYKGLEKAAVAHDRSKNYLIRKAVENYLEDLYFSKKAEEVLAKKEPTYTLEEVMKKHQPRKNALPNKTSKIRRKKSR